MQSKLTLRLDDKLIREAKSFASEAEISLSKLVADYFSLLMAWKTTTHRTESPVTRSLRGVLKGAHADLEDHRKHLEAKYR